VGTQVPEIKIKTLILKPLKENSMIKIIIIIIMIIIITTMIFLSKKKNCFDYFKIITF
jgi:hypothetical protein